MTVCWSGAAAVALARHFREAEGLSIAQVAERLGRSPATIKAYF
jgi:transcriptional regulator with XRE-family HTH domain